MSQGRDNNLIYIHTGDEKVNVSLINHYCAWFYDDRSRNYISVGSFILNKSVNISKHVTHALHQYLTNVSLGYVILGNHGGSMGSFSPVLYLSDSNCWRFFCPLVTTLDYCSKLNANNIKKDDVDRILGNFFLEE